ncbi:MAG: segregation/condensation protein A [Candidatus Aenigmarchaeota archaeon]|nr:segregation/condensation protein A [Candidatus Aenigmarchaeota archaeon]
MLSDQQLIDLMISEPSWEEVIVKIVAEEGIDPWNIDIVKLAECFSNYIERMDSLELSIPARFILIAAILVRMQSDILEPRKRERTVITESDKDEELIKQLQSIPPLEAPVKRIPLRNITLEELIKSLKKAFEVKKRRIKRKEILKKIAEEGIPKEQEDITKRIDILMNEILNAIKDIEQSIEFSRLVKKWNRKEIVRTLMPLLHLSQKGKIKLKQKKIFKEIEIELEKNES